MTDHTTPRAALDDALRRVKLRAPAPVEDIQAAEAAAVRALPDDYVTFLRASNGAEGWIGENFVQITPARQAAETTEAFAKFVLGLFFFAGDGAAGLFAFDLRNRDRRIVITHTDDLNLQGLVYAAGSFTEFLIFLDRTNWSNFWFEERSRTQAGNRRRRRKSCNERRQ